MTRRDLRDKGLSGLSFGFLLLLELILIIDKPSLAAYGGGSGTAQDPYLIYTAAQLNTVGLNPSDWNKNFKLMADVNLAAYTGTQFNRIGQTSTNSFSGVFNGNGHIIFKFVLSYTGTDDSFNAGLFGVVGTSGQIINLSLENTTVTGYYVVGVVTALNNGTISNCSVQGSVQASYGRGGCGGLVGYNNGTISNCCADVNLYAGSLGKGGGIVGWNYDGSILSCWSKGQINGITDIGGLVGYVTGSIPTSKSKISNSYSQSAVSLGTQASYHAGGLVGYASGTIACCYATGAVSGGIAGGLIGLNGNITSVTASFWDKQTSGQATSASGTGKTTQEMQTLATFSAAGWDFVDVWGIGEGQTYPFLRSRSAADLNNDNIVNFCDLAIFVQRWLKTAQ
jgi:hypothetical protein